MSNFIFKMCSPVPPNTHANLQEHEFLYLAIQHANVQTT